MEKKVSLEEIMGGESYETEFKLVPNEETEKYLKTVVAFANGKGGRLYFGVSNQRKVVGIEPDLVFSQMDMIANAINDCCQPKISFDIFIENVEGKKLIVLDVNAGIQCPYYLKREGYRDGVYVRLGATTCEADDATAKELYFSSTGRSYDSEPCVNCNLDDEAIANFCQMMHEVAINNGARAGQGGLVKPIGLDRLVSWGVIRKEGESYGANNAFAILNGLDNYGTRLRCGTFRGVTKSEFVDHKDYEGPVHELIEKGFEYVMGKLDCACDFKSPRRREIYEIPPEAIRELLINAFVHRNYIDGYAPVYVAVYSDRVEIVSPGCMPRGIDSGRVSTSFVSKVRNLALAKAMNYMKYFEDWGSGLPRVNQELKKQGLDELSIRETALNVVAMIKRPSKEGAHRDLDIERNESASKMKIIASMILDNACITTRELAAKTKLSIDGVRYNLSALRQKIDLVRVGGRKCGSWDFNRSKFEKMK